MFPFELLLLQYHERTYGSLTFRQWEQYSASGSPEAAELTPSCPAVESQLRERGDVMWPWPSTNKTRMDERSRRKMMEHRRGGTAWRTPTCTTTDVMMRRGTDRCGWMNQNEWKNEWMNYELSELVGMSFHFMIMIRISKWLVIAAVELPLLHDTSTTATAGTAEFSDDHSRWPIAREQKSLFSSLFQQSFSVAFSRTR